MGRCEKCKLIDKILHHNKRGKKIPKKWLLELSVGFGDNTTIIGPYLQLIVDLLYPPGGSSLFGEFLIGIQYYNQNYYTSYNHVFSDLDGGPYGMVQSASCKSITNYLSESYEDNIPEIVQNSIIVGKLLTPSAGDNGYIDLSTLNSWFKQAQSNDITFGGYMFWSAGYYDTNYPSNNLVNQTFEDVSVIYKIMYIGSGSGGQVYTAEGEEIKAQSSDPGGTSAQKVLLSYANAGFNRLILAFWNYDNTSDWVTDWISVDKDSQKQIIEEIHQKDCKVLLSGGGAFGNVGPNSGTDGESWGKSLAQCAIDNNLDGVDLDLEGSMLGTQWNSQQYEWLKDAVQGIAEVSTDLIISFAPVAPLCANPN